MYALGRAVSFFIEQIELSPNVIYFAARKATGLATGLATAIATPKSANVPITSLQTCPSV